VWYGLGEGAEIRAEGILVEGGRTRFRVGEVDVQLRLLGRYQVYNALAAIAVGSLFEVDLEEAARVLGDFRPPPMRGELREVDGVRVLVDCYNANPSSAREALGLLGSLPGRRIAVLGDMLELGALAPKFHREVGAYAARCGIDRLLCMGEWAGEMAEGAREGGMVEVEVFDDKEKLARRVRELAAPGDWVLVKGSRRMALEEVIREAFGI